VSDGRREGQRRGEVQLRLHAALRPGRGVPSDPAMGALSPDHRMGPPFQTRTFLCACGRRMFISDRVVPRTTGKHLRLAEPGGDFSDPVGGVPGGSRRSPADLGRGGKMLGTLGA